MMWIVRIAMVAAVSAAALGGWACTDSEGNELTLEEYFTQLEDLDNQFSARTDAAFEDVSEDPEPAEIQSALAELAGIIDEFVADIEELDPPEEAQEAHDAAVEAGHATADAYDTLAEAAGEAESVDAVFAGEVAQDAQEAIDQFTTACLDLQQIADDNSIEVALDCGDEEGA